MSDEELHFAFNHCRCGDCEGCEVRAEFNAWQDELDQQQDLEEFPSRSVFRRVSIQRKGREAA